MADLIDKGELLNRIHAGYASFQVTLTALTPAHMTDVKVIDMWTVKDCIAHLIVHEQFALRELGCALRGEPMTFDERDTDSINADAVVNSHYKPLDEVRAEWSQSFKEVLQAIERLSDDDFASGSLLEMQLGDTIDGAFGNNTYEHYAEHEKMIRAWISQQKIV